MASWRYCDHADDNGCVNFAAITCVLTNFGLTHCLKLGDADRDGDVDFADVTEVTANFSMTYCGSCSSSFASGPSGGGLDFMGIEGDVAAQSGPLPMHEALAALGYNSIAAFVSAISAMTEEARNATIQQLGQLLGGAQ